MSAQSSARWAYLSGVIALGLYAGQLLRSQPATASSWDCGNVELADLVEVRRVEGAGPIGSQNFWGTHVRFFGEIYALRIEDEVLEDLALRLEREP